MSKVVTRLFPPLAPRIVTIGGVAAVEPKTRVPFALPWPTKNVFVLMVFVPVPK